MEMVALIRSRIQNGNFETLFGESEELSVKTAWTSTITTVNIIRWRFIATVQSTLKRTAARLEQFSRSGSVKFATEQHGTELRVLRSVIAARQRCGDEFERPYR